MLAGLAGLAAGAFSMAVGEYNSVASQSEAAQFEVAKERREISRNGAGETAELAAMYAAKGIDEDLAMQMAVQVHRDLDNAVAVHSKEEFGIDPDDLASPLLAGGSSFVAFALGALVPLLPYFLGATTILPGLLLTMVALFACGAVVTQVTSRAWWYGGARHDHPGGRRGRPDLRFRVPGRRRRPGVRNPSPQRLSTPSRPLGRSDVMGYDFRHWANVVPRRHAQMAPLVKPVIPRGPPHGPARVHAR